MGSGFVQGSVSRYPTLAEQDGASVRLWWVKVAGSKKRSPFDSDRYRDLRSGQAFGSAEERSAQDDTAGVGERDGLIAAAPRPLFLQKWAGGLRHSSKSLRAGFYPKDESLSFHPRTGWPLLGARSLGTQAYELAPFQTTKHATGFIEFEWCWRESARPRPASAE